VGVGYCGGVDSSTAAALLLDEGYDVIGVTMRHLPSETTNSCCSLEAIVDARRVAKKLGIPHFIVDVEQPFFERVIRPFEEGYLAGITPNPCAMCNRYIKFGAMWDWAEAQGADFLSTGHYVRLQEQDGLFYLRRGLDHAKDQSYLLYTMTQKDLSHLLFPLGEYFKADSRAIAERHGLSTAHKAESQELCFVPKNDYQGYLREHRPEAEVAGNIVDAGGTVIGEHHGVAFYTVGQRRGLGLTSPEPLYVIGLDAVSNQVIVGNKLDAESARVLVRDVNYTLPIDGRELIGHAKIRYNMEPQAAVWQGVEDRAAMLFDDPQWAVSPGQIAVLYREDVVVAGGKIYAGTK
jgi:tRNA-specific 2-thiouridylase